MPDLTPIPPFEQWPESLKQAWYARASGAPYTPPEAYELVRLAFEWGQEHERNPKPRTTRYLVTVAPGAIHSPAFADPQIVKQGSLVALHAESEYTLEPSSAFADVSEAVWDNLCRDRGHIPYRLGEHVQQWVRA